VCRNIRTLYDFEPAATGEEIRAAAVQFVGKISGFAAPSATNQEALDRAVDEVAQASSTLLGSLVTTASPRRRKVKAAKAPARAVRSGTGGVMRFRVDHTLGHRIEHADGSAAHRICGKSPVLNYNLCFQSSDGYSMDEVLPSFLKDSLLRYFPCHTNVQVVMIIRSTKVGKTKARQKVTCRFFFPGGVECPMR
jgi:hypothetical protein